MKSDFPPFLSSGLTFGNSCGLCCFPHFMYFIRAGHLLDQSVLLGLLGLCLCGVVFVLLWRRVHMVSFALVFLFLPLGPVLKRAMDVGKRFRRALSLHAVDRLLLAGRVGGC